jgi:nucleotide-binding universal stress UspA family protein
MIAGVGERPRDGGAHADPAGDRRFQVFPGGHWGGGRYSDGSAWVYYPDYGEVRHEQRKEAEGLVARAAQMLRDAGFLVTTAIETGNPKVVVIDDAVTWHADLIVLGSHGRKGLDRFLMGSVSEAVTRHAPCSVQIVRTPRT